MTKAENIQEIVDNRLKVPNGFFKWAKNNFLIYEWSNKSKTIISSDRKKFSEKVTKRLSLNSRLTFVGDTFYFVWMGVTKKRIEMQMYAVTQSFEEGKEKFDVSLYNFYQLANNKMVKAHWDPYLSAKKGKEIYSTGFQNQINALFFGSGAFSVYTLYGGMENLIQKLQTKSELRYLDFGHVIKDNFEISSVLPHLYKYRERIEFAQKIKARGIVKDLVGSTFYKSYYSYSLGHSHANMSKVTTNFLKRNKPYLKNTDINVEKAFFEEDLRRRYGRNFEGLYELLINAMVPIRTPLIKRLESIIPSTVKPIRFINWMMKNNISLRDYEDYQEMVEALGIPFDGDYVVIPKNWENKHTEIVENYSALLENQQARGTYLRVTNAVRDLRVEKQRLEDEKKEAKLRVETAKRLTNMMKAQTAFDKYAFIFPKDESEIVREGKILHHCVGNYAKRHFVYGTSIIVFVRDKAYKETPLYTLELKNNRIIQLRGAGNKAADEEAKKEAEQFLAHCGKLKIEF
ncbi:PcfJ domain-containing protein [Streptococcus salivarius]|uniref:PcfJ domain-containing protein n=1 Tax=Streptococcus salivarius TaxID=1304 RepID=UPI0011DDDF13|nr:PcfJ domain-containing protein [Streptococcus salivarius]